MHFQIDTTNFETIEDGIWQLLHEGSANHQAAFHLGTIMSVYEGLPYARTVVLRAASRENKSLRFHTDVRSSKIDHFKSIPQVSWLFYSKELRVQLRIQAIATIHTHDTIVDEAWLASRLSSKMCYTISSGPGTSIDQPEPVDFNQPKMTSEEAAFARENFCVVETTVTSIDWLYLHHMGHKRCLIDYTVPHSKWLQA